jgi:hypothetical protein
MNSIFKFALLAMVAVGLKADVLQLKDGSIFNGRYLGGTQSEIWFQRQGMGAADSIPTSMVGALKFGPVVPDNSPVPGSIEPVARPACRPDSRPFAFIRGKT